MADLKADQKIARGQMHSTETKGLQNDSIGIFQIPIERKCRMQISHHQLFAVNHKMCGSLCPAASLPQPL